MASARLEPNRGAESALEPARPRPGPPAGPTFVSPWSPRTPVARRPLADADLLSYRHPAERPALAVGAALLAVLLLALMLVNEIVALVVLGLLGVWSSALFWQELAEVRGYASGSEVTPTQFPALYPIVAELRERWDLPHTRVVVVFQPGLGAHVSGFRPPYLIKVDSLTASFLDPDELRFLIGKEMAHIKFGHPRWWVLAGGTDLDVPPLLAWLVLPRDALFGSWRRAQTLSGDRGGVVACGEVGKAISTLLKTRVGPWAYPQLQFDAMGAQASHLGHGWERLAVLLAQLTETEPLLIQRIQALVEWAGPPAPGSLPLADPDAFTPPPPG